MAHYYDKQGNPCYTIKRTDGKGERPTTIRDARKLGLVIGTTDIIKVASKPGLDRWKLDKILEAIIEGKSHKHFPSVEQWKGYIKELAEEEANKASDRGNELHNKMEEALLAGYLLEEDEDYHILQGALAKMEQVLPIFEAVPERSFACEYGYGGKIDLSHKDFIVDFKTKGKDKVSKDDIWFDYCLQLAAYREGLGQEYKNAKCYNLIISTTNPGEVYLHEWSEEELERGKKMFFSLLEYWKLLNKYEV
jgi:hypothetical protein